MSNTLKPQLKVQNLREVMCKTTVFFALITPSLIKDLQEALGESWGLVEAFKVEKNFLVMVSPHPTFHWAGRVRKQQILDKLKNYGIEDIYFRRKI